MILRGGWEGEERGREGRGGWEGKERGGEENEMRGRERSGGGGVSSLS